MDIPVLLSFAVTGAVTAAILKKYRQEYAVAAGIAAAAAAMGAAVEAFIPALTLLRQLAAAVPNGTEYLSCLLKCAGTALLSELASAICADCGETALAKTALTAGKVAVLIFALPIFTDLVSTAFSVTGL